MFGKVTLRIIINWRLLTLINLIQTVKNLDWITASQHLVIELLQFAVGVHLERVRVLLSQLGKEEDRLEHTSYLDRVQISKWILGISVIETELLDGLPDVLDI